MMKVLLLSASTGGGHNSAAKALKASLEAEGCACMVVDALKFASPVIDKIIAGGYETSAKYVPKTFGALYKMSSVKSNKDELDAIFRGMMGKKILNLINNTKPDAIVGTHPFPLMALMKYKEENRIDIPIISVLTDYTAHPTYIHKNIDAYIVGDEDVSYILMNAGVDKSKIYPYGIPISRDFFNTDKVDDIKRDLDLDDRFTVLLAGGSFGAGNIKDSLIELINSRYDFQIVVITGRDESLKEKLEKLMNEIKPQKTVRILGFTKDMPQLLSIGDVLVTKPGGLTTTEAIMKAIPLVIPYYIPGQEAENIDFLLNNGLALKTFKHYSLSTIIEILIDNPDRRQEIIDRMKKRRKPDSSQKTAELVISYIEKNRQV
jgi:processive 1,2-diacylglycerol beta-glucosyltransferase